LAGASQLHQISLTDGAAGGRNRLLFLFEMELLLRPVQLTTDGGPGVVDALPVRRLFLLAAQLVELLKDLVRLGPGLPDNPAGLGLAPGAGIVLGPLHLLPELPCPLGVALPLGPQPLRLILVLFQALA